MAFLYIAVLAAASWLMATRRLAATLALPLCALAIAAITSVHASQQGGFGPALASLMSDVVDGGLSRLASAIVAVLLGAVLAAQLRLSGAAERVVRYAAEYAGEDRFRLGLLLLCVTSLLFTTLGGLGAVILVASVVLPLMFSLGFEPRTAASILLFGLSLGGCLNPVNWAAYTAMLSLSPSQIIPFAALMAGLFFLVCCVYLLFALARGRSAGAAALWVVIIAALAGALGATARLVPSVWSTVKLGLWQLLAASLVAMALLLVYRLAALIYGRQAGLTRPDNWVAAAAPLLPLLLLLWAGLGANLHPETAFQVPLNAALLLGIAYSALASATPATSASALMRALHEALPAAGPAVMLLLGIGMLLKATMAPEVAAAMQPFFARLPVATPLSFVAVFFLLSPLALFRGPLNLYGMGSGLAGIIAGTGALAGPLVMVALFAVGMLQGVCDPTNTHNVWVANFCRVSTGEILRHTIPWVLATVLLGLCAGALLFMPAFAQSLQP